MADVAEHILRILSEIRGRMTLGEITQALNNEIGKRSAPYTQREVESGLSALVAQRRIAQIDYQPPAYMAVSAKVVRCPGGHETTLMYLLGTAETVQGVKCPTCGLVTMVSAGRSIPQR